MSEQQPNPYVNGPDGQGDYRWGPGEPSYGYPAPAPPPYQPTMGAGLPAVPPAHGYPVGGASLSIGDITISGDQIITPSGSMPLKGAVWNAMDLSRTEEKIPTHAIVLAIVFALLCLVGLLFLLMKEKVTTGYVQVTVTSGGRHHSTMIPATDAYTMQWVMGQLNQARAMSL